MLQNLILNFAHVAPATAGGVAIACQAVARHVPPVLPEVNTVVVSKSGEWDQLFPLAGDFKGISVQGLSKRGMGRLVEGALIPPTSSLEQWFRWNVLRPTSRHHAFPAIHQANTVIHCPYQVLNPLPPRSWKMAYVMNLHDIQHEHYPEFFTAEELQSRRTHYLASANYAMAVCVVDEWTRRDVLAHLPIPEDKIFVAPLGFSWTEKRDIPEREWEALKLRLGIPEDFIFYPAQTWPHKNHARLLEALAQLATDHGITVPLVCTGHLNEQHPKLVQLAERLGITQQIHFLGLIPFQDVQALYQKARVITIPTLFEGGCGIPVLEAMGLGAPLAAASSCGIPDAVGDAALLFDPFSVQQMAQAIQRLWLDGGLRAELAALGRERVKAWAWDKCALRYAEIYREALNRWQIGAR